MEDQSKSESLHELIRKEVEIQTRKEVEIQTRKHTERLDESYNTIMEQAKEIRIRKEVEIQTRKEVEIQTRNHSERLDELHNTIMVQAKEIRILEEVRKTKLRMIHMMNEFKLLYDKYNQMTITVRPRKRISKCQDLSVLRESAWNWIMELDPTRIQNCDMNARVCYAMLVGGYDNLWAENATYSDETAETSVDNVIKVKTVLFSSFDHVVCLIRFVDRTQIDGHSFVVYKSGDMYTTYQSYYGVSDLDVFNGDVFDNIHSSSVNSTTFGFSKHSNDWTIESKCFIYYKIL